MRRRGHVRITSPDPRQPTAVAFNHLSVERDVQTILAGMKFATRVAKAAALERFNVEEIAPGKAGDTNEGLLDFIRTNADTAFHYCGSARMGTDDMAVVDPPLRVRGMDHLRVIDASVMPTVVSGNTNAAVMMIGEKGADLVKADW